VQRRHHCQRCSACPRSCTEISHRRKEYSTAVRDLKWPEVTAAEILRSWRRSLGLLCHALELHAAPSPSILELLPPVGARPSAPHLLRPSPLLASSSELGHASTSRVDDASPRCR
jgi:hypothetical protein